MVMYMLEHGNLVIVMEKENNYSLMVPFMKDIGKMIKQTEKEE